MTAWQFIYSTSAAVLALVSATAGETAAAVTTTRIRDDACVATTCAARGLLHTQANDELVLEPILSGFLKTLTCVSQRDKRQPLHFLVARPGIHSLTAKVILRLYVVLREGYRMVLDPWSFCGGDMSSACIHRL